MTTSLATKPILQIAAGASACFLALVVCLVIAGRGRVSYPDCPFEKLPAGSACVIANSEPPSKSKPEERKAYFAARTAIFDAMKKTGCEKDATPEEAEALKSYADNKYVRAREQSETILRQNPKSFPGMFVRAGALLEGEANPASALRQLRVMRRALEAIGRKNPKDAAAREWYIRCVDQEQHALERLGEDRYAVRCIELLEQVYEPLPWRKTWPLFRMKQHQLAEESVVATEKTGRHLLRALNGRLCLEMQFNRRAESYATATKLIDSLSPEDDHEVYAGNRGLAASAAFKFDEAEASYKLNIKHEDKYSWNTGYVGLADLYVHQGRLTEARDALVAAKDQRDRFEPSNWQFADGKRRASLAKLLLVAGRPDAAERIARSAVERPDRLGTTSMGAKDERLLADLILYAALHDRIEVLKECHSLGLAEPELGNQRALETELWLVGRRLHSGLRDRRALIAFQPHADEMPTTWLTPTLLEVLPAGVAQGMVERAEAIDSSKEAAPYYVAHQAELAWRNGWRQQALELSEKAIAELPADGEALLRTRLAAIAGDAAFRLGRYEDSRAHFAKVLSTQPGMFRSLGIRLPVQVDTDGSETAQEIATMLVRSPRFVRHEQGIKIRIAAASGEAICTLAPGASEPLQVKTAATATTDVAKKYSLPQRAGQAFLAACFSSQLEIDATTINRISGTSGAIRERDAISKTFAQLNEKKS